MQAADGKSYFLVLVKKMPICLLKVPCYDPTFCLGVMTKILEILAIALKQKECRV